MLEFRVRLPTEADTFNFHVRAIPMYEDHSGESMFELFDHFLTALDGRWRQKVIVVTTNGADSMTGLRKDWLQDFRLLLRQVCTGCGVGLINLNSC